MSVSTNPGTNPGATTAVTAVTSITGVGAALRAMCPFTCLGLRDCGPGPQSAEPKSYALTWIAARA